MDNYRGKQKKFNPQNNWEKILKGPKRFFFFKKKKPWIVFQNNHSRRPILEAWYEPTFTSIQTRTHRHPHPNWNLTPPSFNLKPKPTPLKTNKRGRKEVRTYWSSRRRKATKEEARGRALLGEGEKLWLRLH